MGSSKSQWLGSVGGFRLGETEAQFLKRVQEIAEIREAITAGAATDDDVEGLAELLGASDEDA